MQKTLGSLIIGSLLVGATSLWPVGLGQADEKSQIAIDQNLKTTAGSVTVLNDKTTKQAITRGEFAEKLVDALDLNLDGYRFFKAPVVTDFFDDVLEDNSSAKDIMILGYNGLIDTANRSFRPSETLLREEMAQTLANLLRSKGNAQRTASESNPVIKDLGKANKKAADDIKLLVSLDIIMLNKDGDFLPKEGITAKELQEILKNLSSHIEVQDSDIAARIIAKEDGGREVEISWGEKPSSGYVISIDTVELEGNNLIVNYRTQEPDPGSYNSTVITEPKASKAIPANYPAQLIVKLNEI